MFTEAIRVLLMEHFKSVPHTGTNSRDRVSGGSVLASPPSPSPSWRRSEWAAVMPDGGPFFPKPDIRCTNNGDGSWVEAYYFGYSAFRCQLSFCCCSFGIS